jgi:hypothetical protein
MKKYFVVETDEAIEFGEVINLTLFKELEDGKVTVEKDVEFTEDSMDWLIEMGFVEEREIEEKEEEVNTPNDNLLDLGDETPCEALEALEEDFEVLDSKVESLEQEIRQFKGMHKDYVELTHKMLDTFKEFVLSLPEKEEKKNAQPKKK